MITLLRYLVSMKRVSVKRQEKRHFVIGTIIATTVSSFVLATGALATDGTPFSQKQQSSTVSSQSMLEEEISGRRWIDTNVLPLLDMDDPDRLVRREEFVLLLDKIYVRNQAVLYRGYDLIEDYCVNHLNLAASLEGRIESLAVEADLLIADVSSNTSSNALKQNNLEPSVVQLAQHRQSQFAQEDFPTDIPQSSYLYRPVYILYGILGDLSFEDGTFRPDHPVTHGELIEYFSREETFLENSMDSVSLERVLNESETVIEADSRLSAVLTEIEEIRQLLDELQRRSAAYNNTQAVLLFENRLNKSNDSPLAHYRQPIQHRLKQSSDENPIPRIREVTLIPDISESDPVYEQIKKFVEEYGIDMVQADGKFNGEAPLQREALARYFELLPYDGAISPPYVDADCNVTKQLYEDLQTEAIAIKARLRTALENSEA